MMRTGRRLASRNKQKNKKKLGPSPPTKTDEKIITTTGRECTEETVTEHRWLFRAAMIKLITKAEFLKNKDKLPTRLHPITGGRQWGWVDDK
eukprot:5828290-Amphidinium_carterae.1